MEAAEVLPCLASVMTILLGVDAELLGDAVENALVGLMRNVQVDLVGGIAGHHQRLLDHARDLLTAWRNTSRPFMRRCPVVLVEPGPPST